MALTFDTSIINENSLSSSMKREEYINFLMDKIKSILIKVFPDEPAKQQVYRKRDRLNFACPYCRDSLSNKYAKRGNIILTGKFANHYKCFNCGEYKSVIKFLSDFDIESNLSLINYVKDTTINIANRTNYNQNIDILINLNKLDDIAFDREYIKSKLRYVEVKDTLAEEWLKKRMQYSFGDFLYDENENAVVILNILNSGKIIGFQKRYLNLSKNKNKSKYKSFNYSSICSTLGIDLPPSYEENIDTISLLFNIANVKINVPCILLEGPLDMFLLRGKYNVMATCGLNKSIHINLQYVYLNDYDKDGINKSVKQISENKSVFLWSKFLRDMGIFEKRKKWDINDIFLWIKSHTKKYDFNIWNYFSSNSLDILDI